jgi:Sodium:neurotransmitter symporter family
MVSFGCSVYYNMVIAYILRYLFASFTSSLPWQRCRPEWIRLYNCYERLGGGDGWVDDGNYNESATSTSAYGTQINSR